MKKTQSELCNAQREIAELQQQRKKLLQDGNNTLCNNYGNNTITCPDRKSNDFVKVQ